MRKQFKSIAAVLMMVVMWMNINVPVMAAEKVSDADKITTMSIQTIGSVDSTNALLDELHYTGRLTKDKVLGTVHLSYNSKTVEWLVGRTNSDGVVILYLTNTATGEVRQITTTANNKLGSLTWVGSGLDAGEWQVSVNYVSSIWIYDVDLMFYN